MKNSLGTVVTSAPLLLSCYILSYFHIHITFLVYVRWHPLGHTISFLALPSASPYGWSRALLEHNNEWDNPCKQSSFRHTYNDPDGDKRSLPDADIHLASCPDEDDVGNITLSSCGQSASLAQSCSFHSAIFHFFTLFIILFTLAYGRLCQGNLNHCCTF